MILYDVKNNILFGTDLTAHRYLTRWTQRMLNLFCSAFYPCAVLGYAALYNLIRMLYSIHDNQVFIQPNVARLRRISWCCFGVAAVTVGVSVLRYNPFTTPFLLVAVAAAFVGLMLRVVKNVMERAVEIREENEKELEKQIEENAKRLFSKLK